MSSWDNWCVHYNGTVNETCDAGVKYEDKVVPNIGQPGRRLPCFQDNELSNCHFQQWHTQEEIKAHEREITEWINSFATKLANNICPHCGAKIETKKQVGRCVYAYPCGNRLYQGKLAD